MKKILTAVSTLGATLAILVGGAVAANASTTYTYPTNYQNGWCNNRYFVDYNWWEESWMGGSHRDYWFSSASWRCAPYNTSATIIW